MGNLVWQFRPVAGEYSAPIHSHWALPLRPHPAGDNDCRSGLIVEPDHVVDAEIIFWIVALYIVVPDIEDIFPCDRYQRRILLHEVLSLPNQRHTLAGGDLDVDLIHQFVKLGVVPERVVLRPIGAVPGIKVIG